MAEKTTIARPYAKAAFELANGEGKLGEWSEMLKLLSAIAVDADFIALASNPNVADEKVVETIIAVTGKGLVAGGENLVKLLAENKRFNVLPEIAEMFDVLRAEAEKTIDAEVISAFEVGAAEQDKIKTALKNRLGREVTLTCKIDESLLGGAIVRAGDLVIDGSVVGQLKDLASAMSR
jgi:F-type H+-transporting ATPase subunit delta